MRTQLIDELRGTLTLAQCLKCVQHLRALGVYSDAHLQLVFFAVHIPILGLSVELFFKGTHSMATQCDQIRRHSAEVNRRRVRLR